MRRWIGLAAKLYPRAWRERYGAEFQALLDDIRPGWRDFIDVTRGAFLMRLTAESSYLKYGVALALAGFLVTAVLSFRIPDRFVSTAVLRVTPEPGSTDRLAQTQGEMLSRASLTELIQRPSLNLYPEKRQRQPMEDIVEQMRRDIRIRRLDRTRGALTISFWYPDRDKAQEVTRQLLTRMVQSNANVAQLRAYAWQGIDALQSVPMPPGDIVEVLDPASRPQRPSEPNRFAMAACGLGLGLALGLLVALMKRQRWALTMAGFAAAGCAIGGAASFLLPVTYSSSAILRLTAPIVPERFFGPFAPVPLAQWLPPMQQQVLSRSSLAAIIADLDLYKAERTDTPLEDIVDKMRTRDIQIREVSASAFSISFSHPDRHKAQAVVAQLVTKFTEANITALREKWKKSQKPELAGTLLDRKLGANLEVLDPASLPEEPVPPNRILMAGIGVLLGLILGAATLWWRRNHQPDKADFPLDLLTN